MIQIENNLNKRRRNVAQTQENSTLDAILRRASQILISDSIQTDGIVFEIVNR